MEIYLAGAGIWPYLKKYTNYLTPSKAGTFNILSSYIYIEKDPDIKELIPYFKNFMLDSGAFTFMQQQPAGIDWTSYIDRYAAFIKQHRVEKFFELDIDSVVGYDRVKQYRRVLEQKTGRPCIPVWHKSRGKEEFLRLCEEYPYVAIGGIVNKEIPLTEQKYFPWFIHEAHKYKTKIHGLGYTRLSGLRQYHFDSVDSTAWLSGARFGQAYSFTGRTLAKHKKRVEFRAKTVDVITHNFEAWVQFAQYMSRS